MQKQRKLLTTKEKEDICKNYEQNDYCEGCPLRFPLTKQYWLCYKDVLKLEKEIEGFWNEEIDVKEVNQNE